MLYERRRDLRYPIELGALFLPSPSGTGLTDNVSYRGLQLRVDARVTLGQLVRIELFLVGEAPIFLHIVPVRLVVDASGDTTGIGARLLGHDARWEQYVADLQATSVRRISVASDGASSVRPRRRTEGASG